MYSGMGWQDVQQFQQIKTVNMKTLESATFYSLWGKWDRVQMTYNYLDFSVKHLSVFFRYLELNKPENRRAFEKSRDALSNYTKRVFRLASRPTTVVESSVHAVINSIISIFPFGLEGYCGNARAFSTLGWS
jgi:hypothetical protein